MYRRFQKLNISRGVPALMIAGALFTLSQFYRASVAVISPDLIRELGFGAWELGMISASFFYAFALMQIPVSIFLDSIGPRITMTVLTIVAAAGAFIFAIGEACVPLSLGRALMGIGMACNFMGTLKLITIWFDRKYFATLSSLVVSAGTAGTIAAATPLVLMVDAVGWRHSFMSMGGVTLVLAGLCFLLANDRPFAVETTSSGGTHRPKVKDTLKTAGTLLRQKDFWIISLATFCRYGIFAAIQALWAGPYLINAAGLAPVQAGNILLLMSIGIIFGTPFCGYLSDIVFTSRKKIVVTGLFGMTAVLCILAFIPPPDQSPPFNRTICIIRPVQQLGPAYVRPYKRTGSHRKRRSCHDCNQLFHHGRCSCLSSGYGRLDEVSVSWSFPGNPCL